MISMTGYGKGDFTSEAFDLSVEIKTVNNRYLDVSVKAPKLFLPYEDAIRAAVKEKLTRGRVDLFVSLTDRRGGTGARVNLEAARAYLDAARTIWEAFPQLQNDVTVLSLLRNGDVLNAEEPHEADEALVAALLTAVSTALDRLNEMRRREGEKLKADLFSRMEAISALVKQVESRAPAVAEAYQKRLSERVRQYLRDVPTDEGRLLTEVAVFADKCNIDEELTRLNSHIAQFYRIAEDEPVGRKLDFLVQEFNREVNTICSKSNDLAVTEYGLSLKNEIEKVREQVQNLE